MDWIRITIIFIATFLSFFSVKSSAQEEPSDISPATSTSTVTCPRDPPGLENLNIKRATCENKTPKTTCEVHCKAGFKSGNSITKTIDCQDDGTWSIPATKPCSKILCPSFPVSELNTRNLATCRTKPMYINDSCDLNCKAGYEKSGWSVGYIECRLSTDKRRGEWVGYQNKKCIRKVCAPLQLSRATTGKCILIPFGSTCEIGCEDGHEFSNGVSSKQITCQLINNEVVWERGIDRIVTCQTKKCQPLQAIADATNDCSNVQFESTCEIQCNNGFEFSPRKSTKTMTCRSKEGQLVLEPISGATIGECRKKTCQFLQPIANANTDHCSNVQFRSSCRISCNDGYEFSREKSTKEMTCRLRHNRVVLQPTTGATIGKCRRMKCAKPNFGGNHIASMSYRNTLYGDSCDVKCNADYKFPKGKTKVLRCDWSAGKTVWLPLPSNIDACQAITCPDIRSAFTTPPPGSFLPRVLNVAKCPSGRTTSGSECTLKCQEGYAFENKENIHV